MPRGRDVADRLAQSAHPRARPPQVLGRVRRAPRLSPRLPRDAGLPRRGREARAGGRPRMSAGSRRDAPAAVRWTAYVAVAIVFAIACAFLSNWQFSRNAQRSEQLALVAANYDADPVPLAEIIPAGGKLRAGDEWTPVTLTGRSE